MLKPTCPKPLRAGCTPGVAWLVAFAWLATAAPLAAESPEKTDAKAVVWTLDRLETVGGHKAVVLGSPRVVDAPGGKAIEFDGKKDGLILDVNPLAGLAEFTAEIIFQPHAGGPKEQRFFHMQEAGSENRLLFETRLTADKQWFLDTYLKSEDSDATLFAEKSLHPIGPWYHAAVTADGTTMRHYVNGKEELSAKVALKPQGPGQTSLGVRLNKVFWYQGAIRQMRITPRVLEPEEFLKP